MLFMEGLLHMQTDDLYIEVLDIKELEDGSAILTIDMSRKAVEIFAKVGILTTLKEELSKISRENI